MVKQSFFLVHAFFLFLVANLALDIIGLESSFNERTLFATFLALVWYAEGTWRMKNEITTQTELSLKPVLTLYVRSTGDIDREDREGGAGPSRASEYKEQYGISGESHSKYGIGGCLYYLAMRNTGKGTAFNISIKIEGSADVYNPRSNFLAPEGEEQPFSTRKSVSELNGAVLKLSAYSADEDRFTRNDPYVFRYKIVDVSSQIVAFIG